MAIESEDHDIKYANFEGSIPKGQYGAGTVEIWDKGIYENISKQDDKDISINEALSNGHIDILLQGKLLQGKFVLIFFKEEKGQKQWLLRKARYENNVTNT